MRFQSLSAFGVGCAVWIFVPDAARAQDVPGIEICTVEKTMERRTSCLQSNIDFLKKSLDKAQIDGRTRLDAANRQIEALKAVVVSLQKTVGDLQAEAEKAKKPAAAAPASPAAAPPAAQK